MFINFVTIVPVPWDSDTPRYWVGFQVDISGPAGIAAPIRSPTATEYVPISVEAPISDRLRTIVGANESAENQRDRVFDLVATNLDGQHIYSASIVRPRFALDLPRLVPDGGFTYPLSHAPQILD